MVSPLESYREIFLKTFKIFDDRPELKALQFNFVQYGEQLTNYITNENLPTPLTICLNGEWGSGKTTMIKIIKANIKNMQSSCNDSSPDIFIDFNAWQAENANIVLSLYDKICCHYESNNAATGKFKNSIMTLATDIAMRKFGNISYNDAKKHFEKRITLEILQKQISDLIKSRLIVFIDDLDRCNADNILGLLETIKNVFDIKNIVFFITVDIKKIERAWELRYNSKVGILESKEHIEKLFPIVFSLPIKNQFEITKYMESLVQFDQKHDRLRIHLINSLTNNPRKIKRMLNTIFFIIQNYDLKTIDGNGETDIWKDCELHFAFIITWVSLTTNHREIAKIIQLNPSALIFLVMLFCRIDYFTELKRKYNNFNESESNGLQISDIKNSDIKHFFPANLFDSNIRQILEIVINSDPLAFKTIKQIGVFFQLDEKYDNRTRGYDYGDIHKIYQGYYKIFKDIVEQGGLLGI